MNISGRMKVKTLRSQFLDEFGLTIRVYHGRSIADGDATLASIRKKDEKGGDLTAKKIPRWVIWKQNYPLPLD